MKKTLPLILVPAGLLFGGCSLADSLASATMEKSVAIGADTWGGGFEATLAQLEQPVPSISGWFGRRRTWYVSIRTPETGAAAAEVVRAGNAPLAVSAGATGATVSQ